MDMMDKGHVSSAEKLQQNAAQLLTVIRDSCRTSQRTVNTLVRGVDGLLNLFLDVLKDRFRESFAAWDGHIKVNQVTSFLDRFKDQSVFEGVGTQDLLQTYLREKSVGQNVVLKKKIFSWKEIQSKGIPKKVAKDYGYVVPFLPQLQQVLNSEDVLKCVDNPIESSDGKIRTITDGLFYKGHEVVKKHGNRTLGIVLHVDDVETCDPLISKANKHNLRLFYWMLANIHPELRSTLKAINLLAIVKTKVAKKKEIGYKPFLEDVVDALRRLGSEGVELCINGVLRRFYAVLICACCDHPAACNLGGFKESHFALRPCHVCMVRKENIFVSVAEDFTLLRNITEHELQVKRVLSECTQKNGRNTVEIEVDIFDEEDDTDIECREDDLLTKYVDHQNPSVNFGINNKSILSDAPGFDVTKCLPQDLLHLMAEGVCELVCRLVLRGSCFPSVAQGAPPAKRKKVNLALLKTLNHYIENVIDFGQDSVSRPSRIDLSHVTGKKLKQSGAQLLVLTRIMPFVVRGHCSPGILNLLLKLVDLLDVCFYFEFSPEDLIHMEERVLGFCLCFKELYPNVSTIKLHSLRHLMLQTRILGPPRQLTCFHFESMHSEFTSLASVVRTRKDIALSVAHRQLSKRNAELIQGKNKGAFLYAGDKFLGREDVNFEFLPLCMRECFPNVRSSESCVFKMKQLVRKGRTWKGQPSTSARVKKLWFLEVSALYIR